MLYLFDIANSHDVLENKQGVISRVGYIFESYRLHCLDSLFEYYEQRPVNTTSYNVLYILLRVYACQ